MSRNIWGVIEEGFYDQSIIASFPSQELLGTCEQLCSRSAPACHVMAIDKKLEDEDELLNCDVSLCL